MESTKLESLQENNKVTGRAYKFLNSYVSDVGVKRTENQDAFSVAHSRHASLFVIADGMGGARGGATASALAASIVGLEAFDRSGNITVDSFRRVIEQANLAIHARSSRDRDLKGMGTTIAALAFVEDKVIVASVGDSRVYMLSGQDFKQITKDHTFVQELVEKGAIKAEEASQHPISHMLTRSLGPVDKVNVDVKELDNGIKPRDRFLICSDGLYNHVTPEEINEQLSQGSPEEVCQVLLKMALERGGSDNVTIQVIEVLELDNPSYVFPLPTADKIEINLLGKWEQRELGSEADPEYDLVTSEEVLATQENKPAVMDYEFEESNSLKFYVAGTFIAILLTFFIWSNATQDNIQSTAELEEKTNIKQEEVFEEKIPESEQVLLTENETTVDLATPENSELVIETEEVKESTGLENIETPLPYDSQLVDKVVQQANNLNVNEAPEVNIPNKLVPADQPIVWENEELKLEKIKNTDEQEKKPEVKLELAKDIAGQLEQKKEIRKKISDIDYKLQLLIPEFKKEQELKLTNETDEAKIAIQAIDDQAYKIEQELSAWQGIKDVYDQSSFLEYLEKASNSSESIKKIFLEYQTIDQDYKNAVKMWHENPRDLSRASEMGAKARKRDEYFKSMQEKVKKAVDFEMLKVLERLAEKAVEKSNSEALLQSISRKKGYLQASFELDSPRALEMKKQYLSEREHLILKLEKIQESLPDENELEIQKKQILNELISKL